MSKEIRHCDEFTRLTRRQFLKLGAGATTGLLLGGGLFPGVLSRIALAATGVPAGDTLVCVFLRGGADVLNMIVPYGDPGYYQLRPNLAVARPDDSGVPAAERAIDLDGNFFGLHPGMSALLPIYLAGKICFLPGGGSPDATRSHFSAMDLMEGGVGVDFTGWLGRHLMTAGTSNASALRALAMGYYKQKTLITDPVSGIDATVLQSVDDYGLYSSGWGHDAEFRDLLLAYYNADTSSLGRVGQQTFDTIDAVQSIAPPNVDSYPDHEFGRSLANLAALIKADLGVEGACVDLGEWDTHDGQGNGGDPNGFFTNHLGILGGGLAAFYGDLGAAAGRVTVVVMSEFGRQLEENTSLGTDHGHGGFMMVMGDHVSQSRVFVNAGWQAIGALNAAGEIDLPLLTDYRDVLGEILRKRMNNTSIAQVFPNYTVTERGLVG